MKKFLALVLALAMTLALAACGGNSQQNSSTPNAGQKEDAQPPADSQGGGASGTIKIGGIGPLTGSTAQYGIATDEGAKIAIEEINALGGIQFELNGQDDEADGEKGVNAYNNLMDWGMQILYGCTTSGSCAAVAAESFNDRVFQLTPSASSTTVTEGHDNVFQLCFTDPNQGKTAADFIKDNALATKVAVIYNNSDDYSTGIYQGFKAEAEAVGLEIVSTTTFPDDTTTDFSAQITDAYNNGAEMIFLPIYYTPASNILIQASQKGYDFSYFGCDGLDGILTLEGFDTALAEGVYVLTPFDTASDAAVSFIEKYKAATGGEPNQFAADGYDCIYALYAACQEAGITEDMTADQVCEALIAVFTDSGFSVDGLTGSGMQWGANGEVSKDPLIVQITGGAYVNQ
ncbi:MAG: ABC transporter substrate-binding protein [Oscillospiraceae bacterium]|nr:ABC transporter substrate-binding protein [Oscillospiraceae bacterium]MCI9318231.1 ABC transporter substrate-binding protein [Oscillospiraceae bacterium]MDE6934240.1 ABC transporter substrate-binding protein [Oscillospiraceae bacterium]